MKKGWELVLEIIWFFVIWACIIIASFVIVVLVTYSDAEAFEFYPGEPLEVQDPVRFFRLGTCDQRVYDAVIPASERIGLVSTYWAGDIMGTPQIDGFYMIYCYDEVDPYQKRSKLPPGIEQVVIDAGSMATAYVAWRTDTMEIIDCDIAVDSSQISDFTIDAVMTHELLHCVGIAHSDVPEALMWPEINIIRSPDLHADDFAAVDQLYGLCRSFVDPDWNLYMGNVEYDGDFWYGILDAGGQWSSDLHTVGLTSCMD